MYLNNLEISTITSIGLIKNFLNFNFQKPLRLNLGLRNYKISFSYDSSTSIILFSNFLKIKYIKNPVSIINGDFKT